MRVAINGFGRIGRAVFRIAVEQGINVVAVNDVHGVEDAAYLLKYDSVYGGFGKSVEVKKGSLFVGGRKVEVLGEREPLKLPWRDLNVDVVVEATGVFRNPQDAAQHIVAGADYVLISAPCKGGSPDITIVPGVNSNKLEREHRIISIASCTTNCLAPVVKVLDESFGIRSALMTTVHAYTNSQGLVDGFHRKRRRGRAAALNMLPTTTGASEAVCEVIPNLSGKITGLAVRVPLAVGSLVDVVAEVERSFDVEKVNRAFRKVAHGKLKGILDYTEEEIVSSDIVGTPFSAIVDGLSTMQSGRLVKVLAWYDNEFGYSNRVVDVIKLLKRFVKRRGT